MLLKHIASVLLLGILVSFAEDTDGLALEKKFIQNSAKTAEENISKKAASATPGMTCAYNQVVKRNICTLDSVGTATVADECVGAHNGFRKYHGSPDVAWDPVLAEGAKQWAIHLTELGMLTHSTSTGGYGENLYYHDMSAPVEFDCADAVFDWYSESKYPIETNSKSQIQNYNYAGEPEFLYNYAVQPPSTYPTYKGFNRVTGHFTQVIWKASTKIGCGIATTSYPHGAFQMTDYYVVCRYTPAGNMAGAYVNNNVMPSTPPVVFGNVVKTPYDIEIKGKCFDKLKTCSSSSCSDTFISGSCPAECSATCHAKRSNKDDEPVNKGLLAKLVEQLKNILENEG